MPSLSELTSTLDGWYQPAWAESWDAVGLVCGVADQPIERVLLAIDAVPATIDEAHRLGAQLLITHHPLLLTAVHGIAAADPKGGLVHRMIRQSLAHFVVHTNAEVANPGVSNALADVFGLTEVEPIESVDEVAPDKLVVFVPAAGVDALIDALSVAGAGQIGNYERCAWTTPGTGTFRAGAGATPAIGTIGATERVDEIRIEMVVPAAVRSRVIAALRSVHPYEEPAFDLLVQAPVSTGRGIGRIGQLPNPMTLGQFTRLAADRLPSTAAGVRAAGDPDQVVERVAVLAGSGSSLIDDARRAGADVYLTADLKHHNAVEGVTQRRGPTMALVDVAHWASERPWLDGLAQRLRQRFGTTVVPWVSDVVTDPWSVHEPAPSLRTESR